MAAPTETPANRLTLLGALVRQRRVELGHTQQQGAKACGLSNQTYWNVESGVQVRATTYAKVEHAYAMRAGSCQAVINGVDSITLNDGTELLAGAQIQRPSLEQQAEDVRAAVNTAARLVVPGITFTQADEMTEIVLEELRQRGILPVTP